MKPIQFSSIIDSVKANKDKSLTIKLETQELGAEDTSRIFALMGIQIWNCMAEVEIKDEDLNIPESVAEFKGDKTPSQRLRDLLYIYWKEKKIDKDFRVFYESYIEKICENIKEKID